MQTCKTECRLSQFLLDHEKPVIFVCSEWQKKSEPSTVYLVYRWIIALILFITLIMSIADVEHPEMPSSQKIKWLIYFTHWANILYAFQTLFNAVLLTKCMVLYTRQESNWEDVPFKWYKVYWVTNVIATDAAFGVTFWFHTLIYDKETMGFSALNYFNHINNSLLMMLDLFVVAHPIRLLHFIYPLLFVLFYGFFSIIYYWAGGLSRQDTDFIYGSLDWNKPGQTTVINFFCMIFFVLLHTFCWGLYQFRLWLHSKFYPPEDHSEGR